jgi:hypothetical protein
VPPQPTEKVETRPAVSIEPEEVITTPPPTSWKLNNIAAFAPPVSDPISAKVAIGAHTIFVFFTIYILLLF